MCRMCYINNLEDGDMRLSLSLSYRFWQTSTYQFLKDTYEYLHIHLKCVYIFYFIIKFVMFVENIVKKEIIMIWLKWKLVANVKLRY